MERAKTTILIAAAALASCAGDTPTTGERELGWYKALAGACWEGRDGTGKLTDHQCYQLQYGRYLRGTIEIGDSFKGDSVVGWDETASGLKMHFWSNGAARGVFDVAYEGKLLVFENSERSSEKRTRNAWTRVDDTHFEVVAQTFADRVWTNGAVTRYVRSGSAPPSFDGAGGATATKETSLPYRWFATLAGACWRGDYPHSSGGDRQCYAWQYPNIIYGRAEIKRAKDAHEGSAVYFARGDSIEYVFWGSGGQFGSASARWEGDRLVFETPGKASRTVWSTSEGGFAVTVQNRDAGGAWRDGMTVPYRRD